MLSELMLSPCVDANLSSNEDISDDSTCGFGVEPANAEKAFDELTVGLLLSEFDAFDGALANGEAVLAKAAKDDC